MSKPKLSADGRAQVLQGQESCACPVHKRLAQRIQLEETMRTRTREVRLARDRERLLTDLARWPKPFRDAARPYVLRITAPRPTLGPAEWAGTVMLVQDIDRLRQLDPAAKARQVRFVPLALLRGSIDKLRDSQRRGVRNWIPRQRRELEDRKRMLLLAMWECGLRKVPVRASAGEAQL